MTAFTSWTEPDRYTKALKKTAERYSRLHTEADHALKLAAEDLMKRFPQITKIDASMGTFAVRAKDKDGRESTIYAWEHEHFNKKLYQGFLQLESAVEEFARMFRDSYGPWRLQRVDGKIQEA